MRITLLAKSCEFSGAANLARALESLGEDTVTLIYYLKTPYRFWKTFPGAIHYSGKPGRCVDRIVHADWLLMMGCPSVKKFSARFQKSSAWGERGLPDFETQLRGQRVACFATGSLWGEEPSQYKECQRFYNEVATLVFAAPDKMPLVEFDVPTFPYLQPVEPIKVSRSDDVLLSHSPGEKLESDLKGTSTIIDVFKRICREYPGTRYEILSGLSNRVCIKVRAHAHIFVDQFTPNYSSYYAGGLGKSGLEAMACGCATITSGKLVSTEPYFPSPPVLMVRTKEELFVTIDSLMRDRDRLREVQKEQKRWARKCVSSEFVARYVLKRLRKEGL